MKGEIIHDETDGKDLTGISLAIGNGIRQLKSLCKRDTSIYVFS
ncbi:hypothetical protein DNHGIG_40800 [Collibacillus ludicampi]|uniref:Uncharacterized protein n=1 Tax=Collibacillus ludicampi TaxID=2771369 RepID=A0AAV4LL94_9BACL|nr:hypothetical protein DNHGIG_40800 [Collibacillus ludicampi]